MSVLYFLALSITHGHWMSVSPTDLACGRNGGDTANM